MELRIPVGRTIEPPTAWSDGPGAAAHPAATSKQDSRERWRQILAESNREMLRELARQASPNATSTADGGVVSSLERIALDVADRMLSEPSALQLLEAGEPELGEGVDEVGTSLPESPQLSNVEAVSWTVWSGGIDDSPPPDTPIANSVASSDPRSPCSDAFAQPPEFERKFSGKPSKAPATSGQATMRAGLELFTTTQQHTWMKWHRRPTCVLLVAKQSDPEVTRRLRDIAVWIDSQGLIVVLEPNLMLELRGGTVKRCSSDSGISMKVCWCSGNCSCPRMRTSPQSRSSDSSSKWGWNSTEGLPPGFVARCRTWTPGMDELERSVDLVICIGGDGTLCWAAGLFSGAMPPVIAFAGGSLGFLTPFPLSDWLTTLHPLIGTNCEGPHPVQLACRMRFQMRVMRAEKDADQSGRRPEKEVPPIPVQALNEVLVHRGSCGFLVKLEVWVNQRPVTMVQGDGLIVATPTGSTAYSLAAGGSMIHPSVPGILLTPVCPHSLSFRPVVLPDSAVVTVRVPLNARSSRVMVAVDGKDRIELMRGDSIEVAVSPYPLPTVCNTSVTDDWFLSVNGALQWNLRLEQKGGGQT